MRRQPRRDVLAGITVAVVALPLALAFGITSGLGAEAGLVTAVIAGILAAVFGGSNLQISGPTGAMTVVLVPIVAELGANGVLVVGLLAGILLIGLAFAGAGRYMRYVPLPVVEGFTVGIAVIIALQQVPAALGVPSSGSTVLAVAFDAVVAWLGVAGLGVGRDRGRRRRLDAPGRPVQARACRCRSSAVVVATLASRIADVPVADDRRHPGRPPFPDLPGASSRASSASCCCRRSRSRRWRPSRA